MHHKQNRTGLSKCTANAKLPQAKVPRLAHLHVVLMRGGKVLNICKTKFRMGFTHAWIVKRSLQ